MIRKNVWAFVASVPLLSPLVACEHGLGGKSPEERLMPADELGSGEATMGDGDGAALAANDADAAPQADTSGIDQDPVTSELADAPEGEAPAAAPEKNDAPKAKAKKEKAVAKSDVPEETPAPDEEAAAAPALPSDPSIDELINGTGAAAEPPEPEVAGWDGGLDDPAE